MSRSRDLGSKVEDLTHCRGSRARAQKIPGSRKPIHHSRVQEDLAAALADVSLDSDLSHAVACSNAALNGAATIEIAAASETRPWPLCCHRVTRLLRSATPAD